MHSRDERAATVPQTRVGLSQAASKAHMWKSTCRAEHTLSIFASGGHFQILEPRGFSITNGIANFRHNASTAIVNRAQCKALRMAGVWCFEDRAVDHGVHGVPNMIAQMRPCQIQDKISRATRRSRTSQCRPEQISIGAAHLSFLSSTARVTREHPAKSSRTYRPAGTRHGRAVGVAGGSDTFRRERGTEPLAKAAPRRV